jgi:acyl-CoA synthetase (AMP-forming)/AMP-acid ligase II
VPREPRTLRDLLIQRASADPDRLAYHDGVAGITYGDLAQRAAGKAVRLAEMGVRAGDRVALVMSAGIPLTEVFWAVQLLGAWSCAFNPAVPEQTLERRTRRIDPKVVVTDSLLEDVTASADIPPAPGVTPDDVAYLQPTSGTQGEPRAAMLRNRNVLDYLRSDGSDDHGDRRDVLVAWVPPWHDLGLVRFVIAGVYFGAPCHFVKPAIRTIPDWLATISRVQGTITGGPDFAYRLATRMVDPSAVDLSSLRFATNGGEPVRRSTVEEFEHAFGLSGVVMPGYGLAENTLGVTTRGLGDPLEVDARGNVSCGVARPGVELTVDGDAAAPGEIVVGGNYVFAGYFGAPEETARTLRDGRLHTGDAGYLDEAGRLFVLGRRPAMIKRGGALIAPREVEEAAERVAGVRVAAAVSVPVEAAVSEPVVVVVETDVESARDGHRVAAEVSKATRATCGFAPGEVVVAPPRTIPRTANGKVQHGRLQAMVLEGAVEPALSSR